MGGVWSIYLLVVCDFWLTSYQAWGLLLSVLREEMSFVSHCRPPLVCSGRSAKAGSAPQDAPQNLKRTIDVRVFLRSKQGVELRHARIIDGAYLIFERTP